MDKLLDKQVLNIVNVESDKKFWLVRSNGGMFYDEFKKNGYMALGWNYIDCTMSKEKSKDKLEYIKDRIEELYKSKQGTTIINKCYRFAVEMQKGDIVMIPSKSNQEILFGIVGDYYEENIDYVKEIEVLKALESKEYTGIVYECPYKKRRNISIIKVISGERLNPNLYKALISSHGISSIDKYAPHILSSIYNMYLWNDSLHLVFNVEKEGKIGAKNLYGFMYETTELLSILDKDIEITTQININSPGDIVIDIANNIFNYITSHWLLILFIYGAVAGVKIGPITINSLPEAIMKIITGIADTRETGTKIAGNKIDNEKKSIELELLKMDLDEKKAARMNDIYSNIKENAANLNLNSKNSSNIINVNFSQKDDE